MKKIFSSWAGVVLVTLIFIISSFWIYKNIDINKLFGQVEKAKNENITEKNSEIMVNFPDVTNSKRIFKIVDKDIFEVISPDIVDLIVEGNKIKGVESISDISVSPDEKKICFLVHSIVPIWLYVYDLEEKELTKVDTAINCLWSPDGNFIAYNNHTTDVGPVDVLIYEVATKTIKNLTKNDSLGEFIRQYSNITWINESGITAFYKDYSDSDINKYTEGYKNLKIY